jgi:hypothetical protein
VSDSPLLRQHAAPDGPGASSGGILFGGGKAGAGNR